ncbi:MAG TPA: DUF4142 domain-containing protein [Vicinamibacterales bacterium]|nr:DUF4142 domain-containing protein [Vicinamibacterales bacterium]
MKRYVFTGAVVLAMAAAPAFAQTSTTPAGQKGTSTATGQTSGTAGRTATATHTKSSMNAASDAAFMKKAAEGGMAEVELGNLAQQKASSDEVKSFGKRMVDDHSKANDELKSIAQSKNVTLPTSLDPKDQQLRNKLEKLSGAAFDRAYMQAMLKDHRQDVNEFRHESTSAQDPDVKQFASKTLPTLEEHLKLAQSTDKAVGTSGMKTSKSKTSGK